MSCPACGAPRIAGQDRCGACGAILAPPVEGALAPNPAPSRDVPGLRRRGEREKTWKDEVRERVRHRKQEKARDERKEQELPLFRDEPTEAGSAQEPAPPPEPVAPVMQPAIPREPEMSLGEPPPGSGAVDPYALTEKLSEDEPALDDLPLILAPPSTPAEERPPRTPAVQDLAPPEMSRESLDEARREEPRGWSLDAPETHADAPVERPAFAGERARAAAVDLLFLSTLYAVVVYFAYFAGRAAPAGAAQLVRTWPWLVGYLSFLGLTYAAYFTGTTGQTLGKILGGLRVVDKGGRPPGYMRSFVRAGLGGLGVLAAGAGLLPMLVDPARRAFHDKLLGTRVVRQ